MKTPIRPIRFVHALPNAWFPSPGTQLVVSGIEAADLAKRCVGREIASYIRYEDLAQQVSAELGINLPVGTGNCPSPQEQSGLLIVASRSPGRTETVYVAVYDATAVLAEAGVLQ